MGIDISNSLLVGASYEELSEWIESKVGEYEDEDYDHYAVVEEYFDQVSPYYDSDMRDRFVGFSVPNFQPITQEWWDTVQQKAREFEELTGVKPRLRGGANVW